MDDLRGQLDSARNDARSGDRGAMQKYTAEIAQLYNQAEVGQCQCAGDSYKNCVLCF